MPAARLKYGAWQSFSPGGGVSFSYLKATARVANLGFTKRVSLAESAGPVGSAWIDPEIPWSANYGDYDVFRGEVPRGGAMAVRYAVNGEVFWDNNNGGNYLLVSTNGIGSNTVGGNVTLGQATVTGSGAGANLAGEIWVNNLAFAKQVGIVLSADGGATWTAVPATYFAPVNLDLYSGGSLVEAWKFSVTPGDASASPFRFAVYYRNPAAGQTYWDNNFGRDYRIGKVPGTLG